MTASVFLKTIQKKKKLIDTKISVKGNLKNKLKHIKPMLQSADWYDMLLLSTQTSHREAKKTKGTLKPMGYLFESDFWPTCTLRR